MTTTALWLTPLILLPGVALLILSTSSRYGQIHSEFHHLLDEEPETARIIAGHLLARSILFRNSLVSLYLSVAFFSVGSLIGGIASLMADNVDWVVILLSFLGIMCLVFSAVELILESIRSLRIIQVHVNEVDKKQS